MLNKVLILLVLDLQKSFQGSFQNLELVFQKLQRFALLTFPLGFQSFFNTCLN